MKNQYTIQQVQSRVFSKEFPFVEKAILCSGYRYCLDTRSGPYLIRMPRGKCAMCYSKYFNSSACALLRTTRDLGNNVSVSEIIEHARKSEQVFPYQEDMEAKDMIHRILKEYVYIGTESRGVIISMLAEINDNNYVKGGLLHILQRHYDGIGHLGFKKAKSLFPQNSTINEVVGAIVKTIVEGEVKNSEDNRVRLTVPVSMGSLHSSKTEPYLLVMDKTAHPKTFSLITFFPESE